MSSSPKVSLARVASTIAVAVSALVTGCASTQPERTATAPAPAPAAPAIGGGFGDALRCMDGLLLDYGARDIAVIVEDLADQTQRAKAGTKELLVAVVSDMTQRSRAVRLVANGKEWGNTVNHLAQTRREPVAVVPQYALRGSMSQLDTTLALDLTMLSTQDLSVVPGTATRNTAVLGKHNGQLDGRADIRKFGATYTVGARPADIVADAQRALVELAAIETFGRLARVPYWTCLGQRPDNPAVAAEIQDWYDAMAARPAEIIRYFQTQLRARRAYQGPIDGAVNGQLKEAVAAYREALGLSREAKLSLDFFQAYLAADHREISTKLAAAPAPAAVPQPVQQAAAPVAQPVPAVQQPAPVQPAAQRAEQLALRIATGNTSRRYAAGEPINLSVRPTRDAHVYCFLQDEDRRIVRFFPNRFQRDSRVSTATGVQLPGAGKYQIVMNSRGQPETIACFATERDVLAQLPDGMGGSDFDPLPVKSLDQVRIAFAKASRGELAHDMFVVQPK